MAVVFVWPSLLVIFPGLSVVSSSSESLKCKTDCETDWKEGAAMWYWLDFPHADAPGRVYFICFCSVARFLLWSCCVLRCAQLSFTSYLHYWFLRHHCSIWQHVKHLRTLNKIADDKKGQKGSITYFSIGLYWLANTEWNGLLLPTFNHPK